ncbi:MAG TPA: hypothetical protein VGD78_00450, partial [Chthoniobacterales bacterium]
RGYRRVHARFATLPLLLLLTVLASTARSMAQPVFAYALTTPTSPVQPGQIVRFTVKVTNRAGTLQNLRELDFQVPAFTEYVFPSAANAPPALGQRLPRRGGQRPSGGVRPTKRGCHGAAGQPEPACRIGYHPGPPRPGHRRFGFVQRDGPIIDRRA